jgi:hypothetical protein
VPMDGGGRGVGVNPGNLMIDFELLDRCAGVVGPHQVGGRREGGVGGLAGSGPNLVWGRQAQIWWGGGSRGGFGFVSRSCPTSSRARCRRDWASRTAPCLRGWGGAAMAGGGEERGGGEGRGSAAEAQGPCQVRAWAKASGCSWDAETYVRVTPGGRLDVLLWA